MVTALFGSFVWTPFLKQDKTDLDDQLSLKIQLDLAIATIHRSNVAYLAAQLSFLVFL